MKDEGYLLIDHRAGPGLPDQMAAKLGLPTLRGGTMFEAPTLTCLHCTTVQIMRPDRVRERGHCHKCGGYICDNCVEIAREPDYVHMPFKQLCELVKEGKVRVIGGTHGRPQFTYLK